MNKEVDLDVQNSHKKFKPTIKLPSKPDVILHEAALSPFRF